MSAKPGVKSPRSSLKSMKLGTITPIVSASRLRKVQELLTEKSSLSHTDAILCVLGIDGRYHEGSKQLANYLLFGFCDAWKSIIGKPSIDEDQFDDLIIVVKRYSVHVYCHPGLYPYLIDYISHWRNLRLHCLLTHSRIDEDAAEEFKIRSFVSMFRGCSNIGIPHSTSALAHLQPFDKMKIEKWPIVQAFALDEVGGEGFFTMKYQVGDVGLQVEQLYSMTDPVNMEVLISKNLPLFERQWNSLLTSLNVHILDGSADCLTESKVGEPLLTYYKHGRVSEVDNPDSKPSRYPFVLVGDHASRNNIEELQKGENSALLTDKTAAISGKLNLMVCQAVAPKGPLCCARTYSLGPLHTSYTAVLEGKGDAGAKESTDAHHIHVLYSAVIEAVDKAMEVYSNTLQVQQAQKAALPIIAQKCAVIEDDMFQQHLRKTGRVNLSIKAYDKSGKCQPMKEGESCPLIKTVSLAVYDVPSVESPGQTLGSVLFAESFLDSTIKVKQSDGTEQFDTQFLVLTADIPRLITWTDEESRNKALPVGEDRWGKILSASEISHATALNAFTNVPVQGKITLYERAIVFSDHQVGTICLTKEQVRTLQLYVGDSPSKVAVLAVGYTPSSQLFIPASLKSADNTLLVAFFPKSKAYKNLFASVLPAWKEESNFPSMERLSELPEKFNSVYDNLERFFLSEGKMSLTAMEKSALLHGNFNMFLNHISVSSTGCEAIPEGDLGVVLKQPVDSGHVDNPDEILITIISGLPGSHKEKLCQVLTNLAKEQNRWIIFKQPLDSASLFNPKALQQSLSSTLSVVRKKRLTSSSRQPSLLILTPGYTDVIEVVKAISSHPDQAVKEFYRIGAITCCIDPQNTFIENRLTFPSFLNHCALGWVNNIVFTSCTSPQTPGLLEIQDLIRSVNDDVAFILAEQAQVTRSTDIDLILSHDAFSANNMMRSRYLLTPDWFDTDWYCIPSEPVIGEIILRFTQSLERIKLINKLKGLKSSNKGFPYSGNVYQVRGRTTFIGSKQTFEIRYVVQSENLVVKPVDLPAEDGKQNGPNFMVFTGCQLDEEMLKNWLCTTAKKKPEKRTHITRDGLTKELMKEIHANNHLTELPEGWFYNGHQYISLMGDKQDQHPNMEEFIKTYLTTKNKEIEEHNASVEKSGFIDLFA